MNIELDQAEKDRVLQLVAQLLAEKAYNQMANDITRMVKEVGLEDLRKAVVPHIETALKNINIDELIKTKLESYVGRYNNVPLPKWINQVIDQRFDAFVYNDIKPLIDKRMEELKETFGKRILEMLSRG